MTAVVRPGQGLVTASDLAAEEELKLLYESELDRVSKAAENWRTGLAALLLLIGTVSVVKGRSSIENLEPPFAWAAGALVAAALIAATAAGLLAMSAAFGFPKLEDAAQARDWKRQAALRATDRLRLAIVLTLTTLALLASAVGVTWYGKEISEEPEYATPKACAAFTTAADGLTASGDLDKANELLDARTKACALAPETASGSD